MYSWCESKSRVYTKTGQEENLATIYFMFSTDVDELLFLNNFPANTYKYQCQHKKSNLDKDICFIIIVYESYDNDN